MADEQRLAHERVLRLLAVAERVYQDRAALLVELEQCTGLSEQNIERAWRHSFERQASGVQLVSLLASVRPASHVFVVMSANVFTSALRALALALAASARVTLVPSRRDPVLARALVRDWDGPEVDIAHELPAVFVPGAAVHAYGSDTTMAKLRELLPRDVPIWAHGSGFAVAYLPTAEQEQARRLARDVTLFDQRGCLSPRMVYASNHLRFARMMFEALQDEEKHYPRGMLLADERAEQQRWTDTAAFAGLLLQSDSCSVTGADRAAMLPPTGRHVLVVPLHAPPMAGSLHYLTQIVCSDAPPSWAPAHVRIVAPGSAQCPPLDGPVDMRDVWL